MTSMELNSDLFAGPPSELERTYFVLVSQTRLTASLWEGHRVASFIHEFRVVPTGESRKPHWCIPLNLTLCSADLEF